MQCGWRGCAGSAPGRLHLFEDRLDLPVSQDKCLCWLCLQPGTALLGGHPVKLASL